MHNSAFDKPARHDVRVQKLERSRYIHDSIPYSVTVVYLGSQQIKGPELFSGPGVTPLLQRVMGSSPCSAVTLRNFSSAIYV